MGAYEQIEPLYRMYVQGPRPTMGWRPTNKTIASWLGLGLLGDAIEFGNGFIGPYYEGVEPKPVAYLTVGVVYPSWSIDPSINAVRQRASATFIAGHDHPVRVDGDWTLPIMATARAMIASRFGVTL